MPAYGKARNGAFYAMPSIPCCRQAQMQRDRHKRTLKPLRLFSYPVVYSALQNLLLFQKALCFFLKKESRSLFFFLQPSRLLFIHSLFEKNNVCLRHGKALIYFAESKGIQNNFLSKEGFEPPTLWFVATCSSPLSYMPFNIKFFYMQKLLLKKMNF